MGRHTKERGPPLIENPEDYIDHISKETKALFPLGTDMPLPPEITESMDFLMKADPKGVVEFRDNQIARLQPIVKESQHKQEEWNALIPKEIKGPGRNSNLLPVAN